MRDRNLIVATLAVWLICQFPPAQSETLSQAVEQTLKTNPDVLIDTAQQLSTEEALNQAKGAYYPRIDLVLGKGHQTPDNVTTQATYGGSIGQRSYDRTLTLSQMLFDGFGTSSEVDRNRARVESSSHKLAYTSEQTALKAIESYLEVLRQREVLKLTQDNLAVHERTYDQIKLRATSGVGRKSDQDQIEARLALARANLTAAEANIEVAEINYKLVVGSMPKELEKPSAPDASLLPKKAEEAVQTVITNNRILQSAKADLEAAKFQHNAAMSFMYPRLDLELGVQKNDFVSPVDSTNDNNKYAMLKLRYTLFKGGSDYARVNETKQLANEAQEVMRRAERQLEQTARISFNAYQSAHDRLPNLRKHAESSLLTREAYTKQFSIGQRTLLDLLDTENEYFTASTNYVNGMYVELFSRYRVLTDAGRLLNTIGVAHREEVALPAH